MKGRKPLDPNDKKIPVVIFLSKNERDQLPSDLSAAIRLLTKGGKYEQQAEQIEHLQARLNQLMNPLNQ